MKTSKPQKSRANPVSVSATRKASRSQAPLVRTLAGAKRDGAALRRGRENLESDASVGDRDIRTSLP